MEVTPGYKQTTVGLVPQDWEVKKLSDIATVVRGGSPRPAGDPRYFKGDFIPWLTVAALTNISESTICVTETVGGLTEEGSEHSRTLEKETLIIANSGATLGVAKILGIRCCANDGIAALINQSAGNKRFICHFLNTQTKYLRDVVATGNGQPNLNTELIRNISIPFPTLDEQQSIADALSDVDELISALDKLIAKTRNFKRAAMQKLLTGEQRLPGFSKEWEVKKLGEIAKLYQSQTISQAMLKEDGYVVYGANGIIGKYDKYNHERWQTIITCRGSTCGTVSKTEDKVWITGNAMVVNCDDNKNIDKLFLFHLLSFQDFSTCITGSGQPQIIRGPLFEYSLLLPSSVDEQAAITTVLADMDAEIAALEQRRGKTISLKQGMMQELLTGKTRLI